METQGQWSVLASHVCMFHSGSRAFTSYRMPTTHPSSVGTPSCRPVARRAVRRARGCRAPYRCRDWCSLSRRLSGSLPSSAWAPGGNVGISKLSSKMPKANWLYPCGSVNRCWSTFCGEDAVSLPVPHTAEAESLAIPQMGDNS